MDVLLDGQNGFGFVRILEFFGKLMHYQIMIFILKVQELELKIYVGGRLLLGFLLLLLLLLVNNTLGHFTFSHSFLVHFLQKFILQLVIALLEIGNEPVDNILQGNVLNNCVKRLTSKLNGALRAFISGRVF